jgi:glutathione synthase/RimK-type ligase-like ATP-grasp enzyme
MAVPILLVVDFPERWPLHVQGVEVVASRRYLTDPTYSQLKSVRVFNLCRSYAYQSTGYYVSLLAEARGHKPTPDVVTIQDMKSASLVRVIADDLDHLIQKTLRSIRHDEFELSIYFGQTLAKRDRQLGARLFGFFRSPLLRAQFTKKKDRWSLSSLRPIPASGIPDNHRPAVLQAAMAYFSKRQWSTRREKPPRYHLAILIDPQEKTPPSDEAAIRKFIRAADRLDVSTELITRDDFDRIGVFDMLLIRTTTFVNHYTYRFARRAAAEGLAVIDDPVSIARCTNKVYLAERLSANKVPIPHTEIVHDENIEEVLAKMELPCVLKQPDSAFSAGVTKAATPDEFRQRVRHLLEESDLVVAQPFVPTDFDWRVGVLDGEPLYVCKYFMARNHWQIIKRDDAGNLQAGRGETLPVYLAPPEVVDAAVRAANLVGDGLYGVDVKELDGKAVIIEVNDNPTIEAGVEDKVLKDELYTRIIASLIDRVEHRRSNGKRRA